MSPIFKQNKLLFFFSLLLLVQLLCLFWGIVFSTGVESYFNQLKSSSNLSSDLSSTNYSFWNYFWRSGEAMSTHSTISKTTGYQNNGLELIKKFFSSTYNSEGSSSSVSSQNTEDFAKFAKFNYCLQTVVCLAGIGSFCSITNIFIFLKLFWSYILEANWFNFKKLFACLFFNVVGFSYFYLLEKELFKEGELESQYKQSNFLSNSFLRRIVIKLKNMKQTFDTQELSSNLLVVKNLFFSEQIKHNFLKHCLDHYKFLKNSIPFDEKSHLSIDGFFPSLRKKYPINYILKNINLTIKKGSFNIIIGPNGSGKTTLLKSIVNIYDNITGEIFWNGQEISRLNKASFARKVSYIPQFLDIENSISLADFLKFARYPYKTKNIFEEDKEAEIISNAIIAGGCEEFSGKFIDQLSGGQKQKALLASILVQESEIIILDEPTSFLDIKNQHNFLQTIKSFHKQGKTIIMILHDLQQSINYADNLIVMKDGEIKATGHPKEIVTPQLLRNIFSINCEIKTAANNLTITNIKHA